MTANLVQDMLDLNVRLERQFGETIDQSWALAYHVTLSILRSREDAEDVAQDALVKACLALDSLRNEECMLGWIACIAKRLALSHLRAERRRELHHETSWRHDCFSTVMDGIL